MDVEQNFLIFNPPTTDRSFIDLGDFGWSSTTPVRGHNLVPVPIPSNRNNLWAVPVNIPLAPGDNALQVKDYQLLYQYSDFEALWEAVES